MPNTIVVWIKSTGMDRTNLPWPDILSTEIPSQWLRSALDSCSSIDLLVAQSSQEKQADNAELANSVFLRQYGSHTANYGQLIDTASVRTRARNDFMYDLTWVQDRLAEIINMMNIRRSVVWFHCLAEGSRKSYTPLWLPLLHYTKWNVDELAWYRFSASAAIGCNSL